MSAIYTNVTVASQKGVAISNVKSVTANEELNLLESQADGARGPVAVGELANTFAITVEADETAQDFSNLFGFSNKGDFVWRASLDATPATEKIFTITNIVFTGVARSTDQANPNGNSLTGRQVGNDSVLTISNPI